MAAMTNNGRRCPTGRYKGTFRGPVLAGVHIFKDAAVALVDGYWRPVTAATGLTGRIAFAMTEADNTDGLDGAVSVDVQLAVPKERLICLRNDTVNPVTALDLGNVAYALDDQTVAATGSGSAAYRAWAFFNEALEPADENWVWVEVL